MLVDLTQNDLKVLKAAFEGWGSEGFFGFPKDVPNEQLKKLLEKFKITNNPWVK